MSELSLNYLFICVYLFTLKESFIKYKCTMSCMKSAAVA